VTVAACLLLYSLVVTVAGPPLLRRLTHSGHAPRLGVTAWLTAIASVLISWVAAAASLVAELVGHWEHTHFFVASCLARVLGVANGEAGLIPRIILLSIAIAATAGGGVLGVRLTRVLTRLRSRSHGHAEAVHLVGRHTAEHDVVVIDAARPAAYCVPGRPPAIVVTTAALVSLDDRELGAVVAHERAHLAGRHPLTVAALRSLASVFPRIPLITEGAAQVSRLLEMCADDVAARRYGSHALLSGILALSGTTPAPALGAADVAVLARAERLTAPHAHLARSRAALTSTVTMMAVGPLITAAVAASGALMCGI
jgi:Zn-dependent protease with chaperone function